MTDCSKGITPFRRVKGEIELFLIKQAPHGNWSFPKGHLDVGETDLQCAIRELREETGLRVTRMLKHEPLFQKYSHKYKGETIDRSIELFIAEVTGEIVLQKNEVLGYKWMSFNEIIYRTHFVELQNTAYKAIQIIDLDLAVRESGGF